MFIEPKGKKVIASVMIVCCVVGGCFMSQPALAESRGALQADASSKSGKTVAVVIDDFGNGMKGTEEMLQLPIKFTAAVMPFMPTTKQDAEAAHKLGHDVIVHMPMEPNKGLKKWLGPGAITTDLTDEQIRERVEGAIANVPHAVGMNNHMGSKATADERVMRVVLKVCKERGLFFLDSRTTDKSVIPQIARELGVPLVSNELFLDDVYSTGHVSRQVELIRKRLRSKGSCIAIGHVGPPGLVTSAVLRQSIPGIQSGATFVKLSELIQSSLNEQLILPNA